MIAGELVGRVVAAYVRVDRHATRIGQHFTGKRFLHRENRRIERRKLRVDIVPARHIGALQAPGMLIQRIGIQGPSTVNPLTHARGALEDGPFTLPACQCRRFDRTPVQQAISDARGRFGRVMVVGVYGIVLVRREQATDRGCLDRKSRRHFWRRADRLPVCGRIALVFAFGATQYVTGFVITNGGVDGLFVIRPLTTAILALDDRPSADWLGIIGGK